MGSKYMMNCSEYPYKGYPDESYQTNSLLKAFIFLVKAMFKYEIIDVNIRNHYRMEAVYDKVILNEV